MKHISFHEVFKRFTRDDMLAMSEAVKKTAQQMKDRARLQSRRTRGLTMVIAAETFHPKIRRTPSLSSKKSKTES